jgi:hypothetical protein
MGKYQFGKGGPRGPEDLERAIAVVRELGALLLEARELASRRVSGVAQRDRLLRLTERCVLLERGSRAGGVPVIDEDFGDWLKGLVEDPRQQPAPEADKEGILRLANLVAKLRHKELDNRTPERRGRGGYNRPQTDIVPPVPLSVVPRIKTLEAALRISEKVKRQLLLNERVAAAAQTANLAPSALRLLDLDHRLDFE